MIAKLNADDLSKLSVDDQKARTRAIIRKLKKRFPDAKCSLTHRSPLQLLVATILSAQCTDVRVNIVTKDLFKRYKTVKDYAEADPEELSEIVYEELKFDVKLPRSTFTLQALKR